MKKIKDIAGDISSQVNNNLKLKKSKRRQYDDSYKQKIQRVKCTLTKAEFQQLEKQAQEAGIKTTTYLKQAAFSYMNNAYLPPASLVKQTEQLVFLMRNIANNINQIAKRSNLLKKVTVLDLREVSKNINQLEEAIEIFLTTRPNDN